MTINFLPLDVSFDLSFWAELNRLKLEKWMLDDKPKDLFCVLPKFARAGRDYLLALDHNSFSPDTLPNSLSGRLYLFNTLPDYESTNRNELLKTEEDKLWELILDGNWCKNSNSLLHFVLFMYADLKEFNYRILPCIPTFFHTGMVFSDINCGEDLNHVDLLKCSTFPCLYMKKNDGYEFSSFENMICFNSDTDWVILPSICHSEGKNILHWQLRNLLVGIAFHPAKLTYIKIAVFNRNGLEFAQKVSWSAEIVKRENFKVTKDKKELRFDLKVSFNKEDLISQAVDLNLKLTRWRMAPKLQVDKFRQKVLMLGSGTLGCNLARGLLGWGIRHITFVDCGNISISNPIRQSLYTADDSGKSKAEAAAEAIKKIFPGVITKGVTMRIPMPGHPPGNEVEKVLKTVEELTELIRNHDVIFLVTDSRESRWLPTLICAALNKLAITVALGFDSFLVLRHGNGSYSPTVAPSPDHKLNIREEIVGSQLGCYFCLDVTAPGNSTKNRTLDQQCTISRSGLSQIACGIATELFASISQHPDGLNAVATLTGTDEIGGVLGAAPHQIRGFLSSYNFMTATVKRSSICSACGTAVLNKFIDDKEFLEFLLKVLDNPQELENICGLTKLQQDADEIEDSIMPFSDSDSTCS